MGLYEEQIRQRMKIDEDSFQTAFVRMVSVIMGEKVMAAMNSNWQVTKNAVDEILKYYHYKPQDVPENLTDINEQLEYQLRASGVMRSYVRLEKGWYRSAIGPMLGVKKEDRSVVAFIPAAFSGYRYYDNGIWKTVNRKTEELFEDEAICLYRPMPREHLTPAKLLRFSIDVISNSDLIAIAAASLVFTLIGMLMPWLNNFLLSIVLPHDNMNLFVSTAIFLICVSLTLPIAESVKKLLVSKVSSKVDITVQSAAIMRLLNLPDYFFKQYSAGELSSRIKMVQKLCSMLTTVLLDTGLTAAFSLVYVVQIFQYAPSLVLPAVLILASSVLFSFVTAYRKVKLMDEQMEIEAKTNGLSFSLISGIQKIKLAGAEKRAFGLWTEYYSKDANLAYNPGIILKLRKVITTAISLAGMYIIYFFAVKSHVRVADYYAFHTAYSMVSGMFLSLSEVAFLAAQVKPTLRLAEPILNTVPEGTDGKKMVTYLSGSVELSHVSFRYQEDMPLILDDLSLRIPSGQYVAVVGYTGCGKSTLLKMMLGFERPQKGAVFYDDKDLAGLELRSLRQNIGVVMQNGDLFAGDILSNITISKPGLTIEDAWEAAELAGIADDIRNMPMGMYTRISEGPGGISGGQKQRLLIARAIAAKPRILLFDEATSALDNITQKKVSESLDNLKCTRIVIAHRLSTIRQCDRIIVLDKGKIIEDGRYEELIEKNGFFTELVKRQQMN